MYLSISVVVEVMTPQGRIKEVSVGTYRVQVNGTDTVHNLEDMVQNEVEKWVEFNKLPLRGKATLVIRR